MDVGLGSLIRAIAYGIIIICNKQNHPSSGDGSSSVEIIGLRKSPILPHCNCTREHKPVCGSDGITYLNECWLNCFKWKDPTLHVAHQGVCLTGVCTKERNPVCGTDGQTYSNICLLDSVLQQDKAVTLAHCGECDLPDNSQSQVHQASSGSHSSNVRNPQSCACTLEYKPVCGSDGQTYGNLCGLDCARNENPGLRAVSCGECYQVTGGRPIGN